MVNIPKNQVFIERKKNNAFKNNIVFDLHISNLCFMIT